MNLRGTKLLKNSTDRRQYKIQSQPENLDMYWEDCWSRIRGIYSFKYREYRTWKYNRKTQYK